jgi:8-oxo-dGTP diphosphatase
MEKKKAGKDYIGVGGGILILNNKSQVLLMRRYKTRNEAGWWSKPGGGVDFGEKAIDSMKREIKEEVGVDVSIWGYLPHTDHIIKKEHQHWIAINYLAKIKKGIPKIMEPDKCDKLEWFTLNKLPLKMVKNTKESINNYLKGKYIKL